jgi:hypothetical protein
MKRSCQGRLLWYCISGKNIAFFEIVFWDYNNEFLIPRKKKIVL